MFLVLALVAGSVALVQRGSARRSATDAERSATVALAQSLGAQAVSEPHLDLAMLLAREAVALDPSFETRSDLLTTLLRAPTAIRTFHGLRYRLNGMSLSPDAKLVALQDKYGRVVVEDTSTGAVVGKANGWELIGFSPDGFLVKVVTTSGRPSAVKLFDPRTFKVARTIRFPASVVRAEGKGGGWVAFDQGGTRMAVGLANPSGSSQGSIVQFAYSSGKGRRPGDPHRGNARPQLCGGRAATGRLRRADRRVRRSNWPLLHSFPTSSDVDSAAASLDGDTAAFGGSDGSVRFLDLHTGVVRTGIGAHTGARRAGHVHAGRQDRVLGRGR